MNISHAWLQTYFTDTIPSADKLEELFTFHSFEVEGLSEVDGDWVLDLDILPNRASDCMCHRGVAREIATLTGLTLKREPLRDTIPSYDTLDAFSVAVADESFCPRYVGAVLRGVEVKESPAWLRQALNRIGQRSINNIVDATNYVMFELGQPMHAFDLSKLTPADDQRRSISVRYAQEGETITVLTGEAYTLSPEQSVICDGVSDEPIAIAGIKGGITAEISADTTDIVLEAAHFNYLQVRKASKALKLVTDASQRFQNEPAQELPLFATRDAIQLIQDIAGGKLVGVYDTNPGFREREPIALSLSRTNALLGTELAQEDVEKVLTSFGWEFSYANDVFVVTPPWERKDLDLPVTLIEEIGRVYGLRKITSALPEPASESAPVTKSQYYTDKIRRSLTQLGYSEVLTYTLRDAGEVEIANPLASDKSFMRQNLSAGVTHALNLNAKQAPLLGLSDIKLFEIGTRFTTKNGEELAIAIGVRGVQTKQGKLEAKLAEDIAVAESAIGMPIRGRTTDGIFEASLNTVLKELPTPKGYEQPLPWDTTVRFAPWSQYPFMLRDIAVWVPSDVPAEDVLAVILQESGALLVRHDLFDTFEKEGRVSYAWHLVYQSMEKTLTDDEVGQILSSITTKLNAKADWDVR